MPAPLPRLEFRAFEPPDAPLLDRWLKDAGLGMPEGMSITDWRDRVLHDERILIEVAVREDGSSAGFLRMDLAPDRSAELTVISDPLTRRAGVGSRLLERALVQARTMGLRRLMAAVQVGNDRARAFFVAHGFESSGAPLREFEHFERVVHGADWQEPLEIVP